jgi:hypothetical protein
MRLQLYFLLLLVAFLVPGLSQTNLTVAVSTTLINTLATYTYSISFASNATRSQLTLVFPAQLTLSSNTSLAVDSVALNSSQFTVYPSNRSIVLSKNVASTAAVTASNVLNPSSAISTYSFSISSNNSNDTVAATIFSLISYTPGALQSCRYAFAGTTEQSNSTLTATLVLGNSLTIGNNQLTLGYPIRWDNSDSKSLTYGSPSLACSYALNGASSFISLPACSYDSTTLSANLSLSAALPSNTSIQLKVTGVNNPPTVVTATSSSFKATTYDLTGSRIDTLSSCSIADTTISSAVGTFTSSSLFINSAYNTPQINYSSTVPVTFQPGDSLEAYYAVSTTTCTSNLFLSRSTPLTWAATNSANGVKYYSCTSNSDNALTAATLQLYMDCSFTTPPSATPATFTFLFLRNGSYYLNLSATFTALAQPLTNSAYFLTTLETLSAVSASTYSFTVQLSQPLSMMGLLTLVLPLDLGISGLSSCGATINNLAASVSACNYTTASTILLSVYFNQSAVIASGSKLLVSVLGLTNPRYAYAAYPFGLRTYYNASVSSSLVEYNDSVRYLTYTTYTSYSLALAPASFAVFEATPANISFLNQVYLYAGTKYSFTLPSAISSVTFSNLVYSNGTLKTINESTVSSSAPFIVAITFYENMPIGTNLTVPITLKTPSNLGTYGPISFTATYNAQVYEKSDFLEVAVTQTSPISISISVPSSSTQGQYTGATTSLTFSISSLMPHSMPNFTLLITYPSDTSFSLNGTCLGSCKSAYSLYNSSTLKITIDNSVNSSSNVYNYTITLGTFINPKHIGESALWTFQTYNSDGAQVGTGSARFTVALPSPLSASLSKDYRYYRSNTDPVLLYLSLSNALSSGDYLFLQFGPDTYLNASSSVSCPQTLANCSTSSQSTSNILVVSVVPNVNQLGSKSVTLQLSGLVSSSTTIYNEVKYFNLSSYSSGGYQIDKGSVAYNVSCGNWASNACKECYSNNGSCLSCYTGEGMNLLGGKCVSNCTNSSQYSSYNQSGSCVACVSNCLTCFSETACRTCQPGFYYYSNLSCLGSCSTSSGYFLSSAGGITYCLACFDAAQCLVCLNSSSNGCSKCAQGVLQQGECVFGCSLANTYLAPDSTCTSCDLSCNGCAGAGNGNCLSCSYNYYNSSNYCVTSCPNGTVAIPISRACGCEGNCLTCAGSSSYCLSCGLNTTTGASQWAYLGSCVSACPSYSYRSGSECLACPSGCFNCSSSACYNCDLDKYKWGSNCYQDCNSVGMQYDGSSASGTKMCVLCPDGCDSCSGYSCTSCLAGYSLQNSTCIQQCIILGNCASPTPDKVLPLPGIILLAVWAGIVLAVKLLMGKVYAPYSLLLGFCLVELGLIIASIAQIDQSSTSSSSTTVSRLLYGLDYSYRLTVKGLLVAGLVLNYLSNCLYLFVFCRYLWPLLPSPKQIDYITNGLLLFFGAATNYRLGLLTFSRLFPKPEIPIDNPSRLTPVNYLVISSLVLDTIPLAAAIILIYKETTGTNLFMLGLDLLLVLSVILIVTIWMVALPKPEDYYSEDIKKTKLE